MTLPEPPKSTPDLIPYIKAAGETPNVDAKGPMAWDGAEASASLTKDIIAMANSRDGGVIVIGKDEPTRGNFILTGITTEQAGTFETTRVAQWVNAHCQPPVHLMCAQVEHEDKQFVVITVREFEDVPAICTKDYQKTGDKKPLLARGAIYVRTANSESAPVSTVDDVRRLVGLASLKRGDQMLAQFRSMIQGQPLWQPQPTKNPYEDEIADLHAMIAHQLENALEKGGWTFRFFPELYVEERWPTDQSKKLLDENSVRVRGRAFPWRSGDLERQERGLFGHIGKEATFGLNRSGLFLFQYTYRENFGTFDDPWQPIAGRKPPLAAGTWLDFQVNLYLVVEFFMFMSRMAHELKVGEKLHYDITATGLRGRRRVTTNANIGLFPSEPARASKFPRSRSLPAEYLAANWEGQCVESLVEFFGLFAGDEIRRETLADWVEKFKNRQG